MVAAKQGFHDNVIIERGDAAFNTLALENALMVAAVAGVEFVLWELTVPAGQKLRWGFGTPQLPMNQGTCLFFAIDLTTVYEEGLLSLCCQNAPRTDLRYVKQMEDNNLHLWDAGFTAPLSITNDKDLLVALPEMGPLVGKDSRLVLRYNPAVISGATDWVQFSLPVTRYMV